MHPPDTETVRPAVRTEAVRMSTMSKTYAADLANLEAGRKQGNQDNLFFRIDYKQVSDSRTRKMIKSHSIQKKD